MRYQVMELEVPPLSHGKTEDDRAVEVPGRIAFVLERPRWPWRKRAVTVIVELDEPQETAAWKSRLARNDMREAVRDGCRIWAEGGTR